MKKIERRLTVIVVGSDRIWNSFRVISTFPFVLLQKIIIKKKEIQVECILYHVDYSLIYLIGLKNDKSLSTTKMMLKFWTKVVKIFMYNVSHMYICPTKNIPNLLSDKKLYHSINFMTTGLVNLKTSSYSFTLSFTVQILKTPSHHSFI